MNAVRFGIVAFVTASALFAVAMYTMLARANDDGVGNSLRDFAEGVGALSVEGPATTFEEVIVENRSTGAVSTRRYARYIDGSSIRTDVFDDRGTARATTIRVGLTNFICRRLAGNCERVDLQSGQYSYTDLSNRLSSYTPFPDDTPLVGAAPKPSTRTAVVQLPDKVLLGETLTCKRADRVGASLTMWCATSDGYRLLSVFESPEEIMTTTATRFERSIPDGIFVPPYPVVTPTATP